MNHPAKQLRDLAPLASYIRASDLSTDEDLFDDSDPHRYCDDLPEAARIDDTH